MKAAEVDERYLMFVISDNEKAIKEKVDEIALSIMQEYYLQGFDILGEDDL